jgi:hypothetical protein
MINANSEAGGGRTELLRRIWEKHPKKEQGDFEGFKGLRARCLT